jgi:hypothetical protein
MTKTQKNSKREESESEKILREAKELNAQLSKLDLNSLKLKETEKKLRTDYSFLDNSTEETGLYENEITAIVGECRSNHKTMFSMTLAHNLANNYKKRQVYYFYSETSDFSPTKFEILKKNKKTNITNILLISFNSTANLIHKLNLLKNDFKEKDIVFVDNFVNDVLITLPGSSKTIERSNIYSGLAQELYFLKKDKKLTVIVVTNRATTPANVNAIEDIQGGGRLKEILKATLLIKNRRRLGQFIMKVTIKDTDYFTENLLNINYETLKITDITNTSGK